MRKAFASIIALLSLLLFSSCAGREDVYVISSSSVTECYITHGRSLFVVTIPPEEVKGYASWSGTDGQSAMEALIGMPIEGYQELDDAEFSSLLRLRTILSGETGYPDYLDAWKALKKDLRKTGLIDTMNRETGSFDHGKVLAHISDRTRIGRYDAGFLSPDAPWEKKSVYFGLWIRGISRNKK